MVSEQAIIEYCSNKILKNKNINRARELLIYLIESNPRLVVAHTLLGHIWLIENNLRQALNSFQTSLSLGDKDETLPALIAQVERALKDEQEKKDAVEKTQQDVQEREERIFKQSLQALADVGKHGDRQIALLVSNCIGGALHKLLSSSVEFTNRYELTTYYTGEEISIPDDLLANASLMLYSAPGWEDEQIPAILEALNDQCIRLKFPHPRSVSLWPFHTEDPRKIPGVQGDSFLIGLIKKGLGRDEIAEAYLNLDIEKELSLSALFRKEMEIAVNLERDCDIKIHDYVETNFIHIKLFDSLYHPSNNLLIALTNRILKALSMKALPKNLLESLDRLIPDGIAPVHPSVAAILNLAWYDPKARYPMAGYLNLTFEEYIDFYVSPDDFLRRKSQA